jgi:hypothetical protein
LKNIPPGIEAIVIGSFLVNDKEPILTLENFPTSIPDSSKFEREEAIIRLCRTVSIGRAVYHYRPRLVEDAKAKMQRLVIIFLPSVVVPWCYVGV